MAVGLKFSVPVIFGVLTDDTMQQAQGPERWKAW
jgi:6,7-dimethyl-8-ribityllumazine synthase